MRVGADVGGTFTDVVVLDDDGRVSARKVPSSPHAFEEAVVEGSAALVVDCGGTLDAVVDLRHGTTVATNAVLERSGPLTAVITTRGFRDVLELGRLRTPALYDLDWSKPVPLATRRYRLEVDERMSAAGEPVTAPDLESLRPAVERAVAEGVTTMAVSLLNAYADPAHEELVAGWLEREFPELDVTVATRFVREIGEYERTSTAVANAYLRPVVSGYLQRLESSLAERGSRAPVFVMQSSGGMMPVGESGRFPAHLLESGPAAGVLAAADVARAAGLDHAISFDMGGTTAKASLLEDYTVAFASEFSVGSEVSAASQLLKGGGYTVHLPVVDLAEVGAGGGSIARVDAAGGLHVGPRSAGAAPGPACYARGGELPTVTDANLLLGYVDPEGLRSAGIDVDVELARTALAKYVAEPLGITVDEAALAVHDVADRQMARVLRAVTTERGKDVAAHTLVAFGGSGPLHAATMAATVGIASVVVPPLAGVHSAVGLLTTPFELTTSETLRVGLAAEHADHVRERTAAIGAAARERFDIAGAPSGVGTAGAVSVRQVFDVRYRGQASELAVEVDVPLDAAGVDGLRERFHALHRESYGHALSSPVEIVRVRTTVTGGAGASVDLRGAIVTRSVDVVRRLRFPGVDVEVMVLGRADLDAPRPGPFVVDDPDTTTVVPPGWTAVRDERGNLRLERQA
ncbi:hydantoinase/oxoprolinase family protein [Pseudonocardia sp. GCM10023141]|uniref:hydantoinase/oxoprolinase family protein n=1 Tax=Pseudonocardia sp. GCM10023141 TaxID=3252653 RepID=UPI00360E6DF3